MKTIPFSSVLLIDNSEVDNFVNQSLLNHYGISSVFTCKYAKEAINFIIESKVEIHLIIIEIYLPIIDGFEFIDRYNELDVPFTKAKIVLLSTYLNPFHKKQAEVRDVSFIEKPFTIEKLIGLIP